MNEKWTVLTYRDYDFTDDNGRNQKGRTLHCYRASKSDGWPGVEYGKFSCKFGSDAYNVIPTPGKVYELVFNRYGKVENMIPAA